MSTDQILAMRQRNGVSTDKLMILMLGSEMHSIKDVITRIIEFPQRAHILRLLLFKDSQCALQVQHRQFRDKLQWRQV